LAKRFHPDLNKSNPEAEETLKKINMAYTVLKLAYKKFDDLEAKAEKL
jgi:curved DNA-binding protein CbpA